MNFSKRISYPDLQSALDSLCNAYLIKEAGHGNISYYIDDNCRIYSIVKIEKTRNVSLTEISQKKGKRDNYVRLSMCPGQEKQFGIKGLVNFRHTVSTSKMQNSMSENSEMYKKNFRKVVKYISYTMNLSEQDAEDIVQDSYIYICIDRYKQYDDFMPTWIYFSKKKAIDVHRRLERFNKKENYEFIHSGISEYIDTEILIKSIGKERAEEIIRMKIRGYNNKEIEKITGYKKSTVQGYIAYAKKMMANNLKNEL